MSFSDLAGVFGFLIVLLFALLAFSFLVSTLVEGAAGVFGTRRRMLRARLATALDDPDMIGFARMLFNSPLIRSLQDAGRTPDYIPSDTFAQAVLSILEEHNVRDPRSMPPVLREIALAEGLDNEKKRAAFKERLITWYDEAMERLSGSYRSVSRTNLFATGFVVAVCLNINLINVTTSLWDNRSNLSATQAEIAAFYQKVQEAQEVSGGATPVDEILKNDEALRKEFSAVLEQPGLSDLKIPVGWEMKEGLGLKEFIDEVRQNFSWSNLLGWLLAALAVLPGAAFWFDTLGKVFAMRSVGRSPTETQVLKTKGTSADRAL